MIRPLSPANAQGIASRERLAKSTREFLAWNAAQPEPIPACRKCGMPFHPADCGDLFPSWCLPCELTWTTRLISRLIGRFGRVEARERLRGAAR